MATTVLSFPSWFDEAIVNKIADEELFSQGELHQDQLADLWGFVKRFQPSDGHHPAFSGDTRAVFVKLCHAVEIEKLRYKIGEQTEMSPNRLAAHISRQSRAERPNRDRTNQPRQTVDIRRIREHSKASIPIHTVQLVDGEVVVTVDDTDIHVKKDGIYGSDMYENGYCISFSSINERVSEEVILDSYVETTTNPGTSIVRISTQKATGGT